MSLKLDPRVRSIATICSVTEGCADWPDIINKKGYFANRIADFQDLKKCAYGKFAQYREHDNCFLCEDVVDKTFCGDWYAYFLREDLLQPVKKKYRPFSLEEFLKIFDIGDQIGFRSKDNGEVKHAMFVGYADNFFADNTDRNTDKKPGKNDVMIGIYRFSLSYLFDDYELLLEDDWQPFGVIDEGKE